MIHNGHNTLHVTKNNHNDGRMSPPPTQSDFAKTILFTNDSAPGPDGIPYAAWRIHPGVASEAMSTHLDDICRAAVPPPCSVQAWIPKAKLGPTADHFRPLGMPSTFERIIDGSIAAVLTKAIAPLLHPSQTVLNLFREPQGAVQSIQNTLDHRLPCAVLSLDLSKAFERVNPYWLLQILSACRAPLWVIAYTRHILLFRRCRHKVQGRLLPSKMIVTGVDMGRSFSVLLFCIAMDPILTYLNRIPGMLTVQGYVDDTTMAGDTAAGMLHDAWTVCKNLKSAGIQIDEHHCWKASGIHAHGSHEGSLTDFPALAWVHLVQGYPTLRQALLQRTGYTSTTIVSRGESFVCLTPREVDQLLAGVYIKRVDLLFLAKCKCSNKCSVLVNHPASQSTLYALECSHWGAHLIEGKSSALGLLLYGRFTRSPDGWVPVDELVGTQSINPKAMNKANQRLALFSTPAHSVVQRSLANNCFILSLNIYQSTYFGFNWNDVNLYQQRSAKLILGRVWLAARYLPHIFRWLRIAPALDPAITLTNACLGYWFRQNGSSAILSPGYSDVEMRQGAVVQQVFRAWVPLLGIDKVGNLLRLVAGQYSRKSHLRFLQQFKPFATTPQFNTSKLHQTQNVNQTKTKIHQSNEHVRSRTAALLFSALANCCGSVREAGTCFVETDMSPLCSKSCQCPRCEVPAPPWKKPSSACQLLVHHPQRLRTIATGFHLVLPIPSDGLARLLRHHQAVHQQLEEALGGPRP